MEQTTDVALVTCLFMFSAFTALFKLHVMTPCQILVTDVTEFSASSVRVVKVDLYLDLKTFDCAHASRYCFSSELWMYM